MKFRFEDQPHQAAAIKAVTDLFDGALTPPLGGLVGQAPGANGHADFTLERDTLSDQLAVVTEREDGVDKQSGLELLEVDDDLQGESRDFPNFSVEMETGTGKTYVYIATALQTGADPRTAQVRHPRPLRRDPRRSRQDLRAD